MQRIVLHLDMDAFFAAAEERDRRGLKGKPIVVGADPHGKAAEGEPRPIGRGRGVVSTANYKAREYGIHSAMPISEAWRLSQIAKKQGKPEAEFLPVDMDSYHEISEEIMGIIKPYTSVFEQTSVDEAYFEIEEGKLKTENEDEWEQAKEIAKQIKNEIKEKEKLTCSVGIGPNKMIAKIAANVKKPDGLVVVRGEEAEEFLENFPVRIIPGIGPKAEEKLLQLGVKTVKDLKRVSAEEMDDMFGKWGLDLYQKARGIDDSEVLEEHETKSIGEQETFEKDTRDHEEIFKMLDYLCKGVMERFNQSGFKTFETVAVIVRFADFENKIRSHTLAKSENSLENLKYEVMKLFSPFLDTRENPRKKPFRLLGVRVERLK